MILPIFSAGLALFYRRGRSGYYIEHDIEWASLLFFMFLFIQAGVFHSSGVAAKISEKVLALTGDSSRLLVFDILLSSAVLSSILDNTVVVGVRAGGGVNVEGRIAVLFLDADHVFGNDINFIFPRFPVPVQYLIALHSEMFNG